MPANPGNPDLFKSLGEDQVANKAFNEAKTKEVRHDAGGNLPPNIEKGVARLTDIKLDTHKEGENKGKTFFFIRGVVLEPVEHQAAGVSFIVPLYDGKPGPKQKTKADRIDEMLNYIKLLGVETAGIKIPDLKAIFNSLKSSGPIFGFRTWAGKPSKEYPNPRTNTVFKGLVESSSALPDPGAEIDDNTGDNGDSGEVEEEIDWETLGAAADDGDSDAQEQITKACLGLGMKKSDLDKTESWTVAAQIAAAGKLPGKSSKQAEPSEDEAPFQPSVDDVVQYKPKGARKHIECQVTHVFKTTLNLKNLETNQIYKSVAYTESPPTLGGNPVV